VLGYKFDIPDTWTELPISSERMIEVGSCKPGAVGCDYASLTITVASASQTTVISIT